MKKKKPNVPERISDDIFLLKFSTHTVGAVEILFGLREPPPGEKFSFCEVRRDVT